MLVGIAGAAHAQKISQFPNEPGTTAALSDAVVTESQNCPLSTGAPGNCRTTVQQILNTPGSLIYAPLGTTGGTVTNVSVATAGGLSGTVASPSATPVISLGTTVSGVVKGSSGSLVAATPGVDFLAPGSSGGALTGITWSQISSTPTTLSGYGIVPVTTTGAGTNQGTAQQITANIAIFTTVASGQGGILTLPLSIVINAGANPLSIYPKSGGTITGGGTTLATNAAFMIGAGSSATFACPSPTACYAAYSSFQ